MTIVCFFTIPRVLLNVQLAATSYRIPVSLVVLPDWIALITAQVWVELKLKIIISAVLFVSSTCA